MSKKHKEEPELETPLTPPDADLGNLNDPPHPATQPEGGDETPNSTVPDGEPVTPIEPVKVPIVDTENGPAVDITAVEPS